VLTQSSCKLFVAGTRWWGGSHSFKGVCDSCFGPTWPQNVSWSNGRPRLIAVASRGSHPPVTWSAGLQWCQVWQAHEYRVAVKAAAISLEPYASIIFTIANFPASFWASPISSSIPRLPSTIPPPVWRHKYRSCWPLFGNRWKQWKRKQWISLTWQPVAGGGGTNKQQHNGSSHPDTRDFLASFLSV